MKKHKSIFLTQAAMIAALYVLLTYFANLFGLANQSIQVRFSEALTILPYFIPAAIPGLFSGCILSNLLTGCSLWDVIFGSIATLLGALGTYYIGRLKSNPVKKWLAPLPPVFSNTLIIPFILAYIYETPGSFTYFFITVGVGEIISCYILGMLLFFPLEKHKRIFK